MKKLSRPLLSFSVMALLAVLLLSLTRPGAGDFHMPWKQAGITERQAAAHLLDRFTFGARPGDVDAVVKAGLEKWFLQQLDGNLNDDQLKDQLKEYDALRMTNEQVLKTFPRGGEILKRAVDEGVLDKAVLDDGKRAQYKNEIEAYMKAKGLRREQELYMQFANQKILSAAYSNNQLHQVLTDFWYNHFNVSATKNDCAQFIPSYERDVIRPHVSGKFGDLLLATAQSPAMLFYLDNFNSAGVNEDMEARQEMLQKRMERRMEKANATADSAEREKILKRIANAKKNQGLNENYAREIMELHTLGVDGGYSQTDVTEAARVLTGWTVYPIEGMGFSKAARRLMDKFGEDNLRKNGFYWTSDFMFAMNRHDIKEKKVLGKVFPAGGGYQEGLDLIKMLAAHPSTAQFISKKLATRFVSDNPPASLISKMAAAYTKSDGDIRQVLMAMVAAPEFWQKESFREKTKSPFELAISTVRVLNAKLEQPFMLYQWIAKMGQQLYYYQAPTGFPDRGQYWINTGSLLNRMKFGLAFAAQKIPGVSFNLAALNNNHEPESAEDALKTYSKILMPERNLDATIKRLEPMINDPAIGEKVDAAAVKQPAQNTETMMGDDAMMQPGKNKNISEEQLAQRMLRRNNGKEIPLPMVEGNNSMLALVVGVIIGSPEFQRR